MGENFAFGVVLYDSTDVVSYGDRFAAAPPLLPLAMTRFQSLGRTTDILPILR
ncbi:hypothetical protein [Rhizobium vallis]|uniref:hypothetical protein n=1 Tax=Rhizobium vallis TaxID=634290 RepID=UPI001FE22E23|nr:hypothetical protein [Rhizobium vallis]